MESWCGRAGRCGRGDEGFDHVLGGGAAQREAFDRILGNHLLYCTVCDNNNGNCTVHNTTKMLAVEHQAIPFKTKPYEIDDSNPFYRYDPDQCILCGRCVEACQNVQVNETLSIRWEDAASAGAVGRRVDDWRIELRFLRALRHGVPVQRADGEIDAGACGFFYGAAQAGAGRDDRRGEGDRAGERVTGRFSKVSEVEGGDAEIANQAGPRRCARIAGWGAASISGRRIGTS